MQRTGSIDDRRVYRRWLAATIAYWLLMAVAFHMPIPKRAAALPLPENSDKTIHFVLYAGFSLLLCRTVDAAARARDGSPRAAGASQAIVFLVCALNGYVDEVTQPLTNRYYDLGDVVADGIGAVLGIAAYWIVGYGLLRLHAVRSTDARDA